MSKIKTIIITTTLQFESYDKKSNSFVERWQRNITLPLPDEARISYEKSLKDSSDPFYEEIIHEEAIKTLEKHIAELTRWFANNHSEQNVILSLASDPEWQVVEQE